MQVHGVALHGVDHDLPGHLQQAVGHDVPVAAGEPLHGPGGHPAQFPGVCDELGGCVLPAGFVNGHGVISLSLALVCVPLAGAFAPTASLGVGFLD